MASIQVIIWNPSQFPTSRRHLRHDRQEKRTQVVPEGRRREAESRAQASHRVGSLIVVELKLPDECEDLSTSDKEVLRHLPKDRDGDRLVIVEVIPPHVVEPVDLKSTSHNHGEDGDHEPDPHPLELGESPLVLRVAPRYTDDDQVVHERAYDDAHCVEEREGGGWDLEIGPHVLIHRVAL